MNNLIKNLVGAAALLLSLALIILVGVEVKNRYAAQIDLSKTRSITMTAEGKVTAKPDTAAISFSVVTQGKEASKVQEENDKKMKTVVDFLKSQGIKEEDIKTSNYNLYPQYDYNVRQPERAPIPPAIIGYSLNQSVSVKVRDLGLVQSLVGSLTSKGVNQIDTVSYFIDDPDNLKAQARAKAIDKAKEKADELVTKLGVKLGRVINFSEGNVYIPQPLYARGYPAADGYRDSGGPSPIQSGTEDITVDVTVTYELK